jgi:hypothetical protein
MDLPASATTIFFVIIGILIVLEVIALYMIYSYFKLLRSYDSVMKKQREMEASVRERSEKLLEAAQDQAQAIVLQANSKAQGIITAAGSFNQDTQAKIDSVLAKFLTEEMAVFKQMFDNVREQTAQGIDQMHKAVETQAVEQLSTSSKQFALAMSEAQKKAQERLERAYQQAEADINTYKQKRLEQLAQLTAQFLQAVSQRLLKKTLTAQQQQTLVMEALDEAKRENLF